MQEAAGRARRFSFATIPLQLLDWDCSWWPFICSGLSTTRRTVTQMSVYVVLFAVFRRPGGTLPLLERYARLKIFLNFRACRSLGVKRRSGGAAFCAQVWRIGPMR
jgi:hypothetical protein